jgi:hypothetical protein
MDQSEDENFIEIEIDDGNMELRGIIIYDSGEMETNSS